MKRLRAWLAWYATVPAVFRWAVVFASMGALWWSSAQPRVSIPAGGSRELLHNSAHVVAFAILGAAAMLAIRRADCRDVESPLVAIAIAICYGVVDELHQSGVPGRVCSVADACADAFGAALAIVGLHCMLCEAPIAARLLPWLAIGALASVGAATWMSL
jgi:VanZ family protein